MLEGRCGAFQIAFFENIKIDTVTIHKNFSPFDLGGIIFNLL